MSAADPGRAQPGPLGRVEMLVPLAEDEDRRLDASYIHSDAGLFSDPLCARLVMLLARLFAAPRRRRPFAGSSGAGRAPPMKQRWLPETDGG